MLILLLIKLKRVKKSGKCSDTFGKLFKSGSSLTSKSLNKGLIVLNVTQCQAGSVDMDAYATGVALKNEGVVSGYDSTFEAALAKLFFLLGQYTENDIVRVRLRENVKGEISR